MKRNILLITTDQMRYDALGCNGGKVAKTPTIDGLSSEGINFRRAHNQNVVCMPARATIITGQHVGSHGVWMNGVSMPEDRDTIAHHLQRHGYATGLLGKAHFEPWLGSPETFYENRMAKEGSTGPHRGFDHMVLANHFFEGHSHYDKFMDEHPEEKAKFFKMISESGQSIASSGKSGALQVWPMDVPKALYHTDWVADRTIDWLASLEDSQPFFTWMSFPDPHHPWDVPESEMTRINLEDVPLPSLYRNKREDRDELINLKPSHWRGYYNGSVWSNLESPKDFTPAEMTPEQVREINQMTHIENELIDDACARVIKWLDSQGKLDNTDIIFTTDHGEFQGDFGLMFKGPYHVDALMRLPMIWKPAALANICPAEVTRPVGHVDLAKTFCEIANIDPPSYCEGLPLPKNDEQASTQNRDFVLTEWDSEHGQIDMHLKTIYHNDGWLCTCYEKSHLYDGTEGELYDMNNDPEQIHNLWDDPNYREKREALKSQLYQALPGAMSPRLERLAPV
jgi:arylsulfatase A-like enzyme